MSYGRRAQVLFEEGQYKALEEEARRQHKGVGPLIREVVERELFQKKRREKKISAAERLCSLNLPQEDWSKIKASLIREKAKGV